MADRPDADQLAAQAAEAVKQVIAEAESRAAEIVRDAEAKAASVREQAEADAEHARERAEKDARAQIEAAKRALDELGGTLAAAASAAIPKGETEPQETETEPVTPPTPEPDPEPAGAPEAPTSPPAEQLTEPSDTAPASGDAAERLVAMKLAVEGMDPSAIEAELVERFGPGDRSALLKEVLARVAR